MSQNKTFIQKLTNIERDFIWRNIDFRKHAFIPIIFYALNLYLSKLYKYPTKQKISCSFFLRYPRIVKMRTTLLNNPSDSYCQVPQKSAGCWNGRNRCRLIQQTTRDDVSGSTIFLTSRTSSIDTSCFITFHSYQVSGRFVIPKTILKTQRNENLNEIHIRVFEYIQCIGLPVFRDFVICVWIRWEGSFRI